MEDKEKIERRRSKEILERLEKNLLDRENEDWEGLYDSDADVDNRSRSPSTSPEILEMETDRVLDDKNKKSHLEGKRLVGSTTLYDIKVEPTQPEIICCEYNPIYVEDDLPIISTLRKRKRQHVETTTVDQNQSTSPIVIDISSDESSPIKQRQTQSFPNSKGPSRQLYDCTFSDSDSLPEDILPDAADGTATSLFYNTKSDPIYNHMDDEIDGSFQSFYEEDPLLPIYKPLKNGIKTKTAAALLLSNISEKHLARNVPLSINKNVSFIYSASKIGHWKNALCDSMGRWNQMGTETSYVNQSKNGEIEIAFKNTKSTFPMKCTRRKYQNFSCNSLHRIVITLSDEDDEVKDQFFVQYYFDGQEQDVQVEPHGNSKKARPYQRTSETTKERIEQLCQKKKSHPKDVFHSMLEEQGGLEKVKSGSLIPRDQQQIKNFKRNIKTDKNDPLLECADKAKRDSSFLRDVRAAPEFSMFMCTQNQLDDIEKFCTNNKKFSVLGVDTTFNIGKYFITIVTYRHLMLHTARQIEPVMIGPILLHQRKTFESFFKLPSNLIEACKNLVNIKVFGTDGDVNLSNAFQVCFPESKHLLCDLHMEGNIERKLSKLGIRSNTARQYMNEIFGHTEGTSKHKGLVDCLSPEEFDKKLDALKQQWNERHPQGKSFTEYFLDFKAELIKHSMSAELRAQCGLGFPPKMYDQNGNECINHVLKSAIEAEKGKKGPLDPYDFVRLAEKTIRRQENSVKLAIIGRGEYCIKQEYQHLMVEEKEYWRKTPAQRELVSKRFHQEPLTLPRDTLEEGYDEYCGGLPISAEESQIINVPFRILTDMFKKASELDSEDGQVVIMPGCKDGKTLLVANELKESDPYVVTYKSSSITIECDKKCARYNSFRMCEHTLAVANHINIFDAYLKRYKTRCNQQGNVTEMANTNMPVGRGKKALKATQRRRGAANKSPVLLESFTDTQPDNRTSIESANQQNQSANMKDIGTKPAAPNPLPGSYMIALLKFCNQHVTKCFGCLGQLKPNKELPSAPRDMVVVGKMKRKYFNKDGVEKESPLSNVYFHFNEQCIKSKDSYFVTSLLYCPGDLRPHLNTKHIERLSSLNIQY